MIRLAPWFGYPPIYSNKTWRFTSHQLTLFINPMLYRLHAEHSVDQKTWFAFRMIPLGLFPHASIQSDHWIKRFVSFFPNWPLWLNHPKKAYPTLTSPIPSPKAQVNVLEPCLLVWGGGCKVETICKNVKVCAPFIKTREGCFESPKFLL